MLVRHRSRVALALRRQRAAMPICLRCYWEDAASKLRSGKPINVLGIETSCDDTCVAVLRVHPPSPVPPPSGSKRGDIFAAADALVPTAELLHNGKITSNNLAVGGIHPVIALRSHRANLPDLVKSAVEAKGKPDVIAVTRGPGQMNSLEIGLGFAKGMAFAFGVPLVGVNHMHAHSLTVRLVGAMKQAKVENVGKATRRTVEDALGEAGYPQYPFLSLLVSGGHTLLVLSTGLTENKVLADSLDTAVGDAIDKIARILLPEDLIETAKNTNYGRLLEQFVFEDVESRYDGYDPEDKTRENAFQTSFGWTLPKPLESQTVEHRGLMKFSFAGLRAHLDRNFGLELAKSPTPVDEDFRRELAWLSQKRAFEHLAGRVLLCLRKLKQEEDIKIKDLVVSGGVASNKFLRVILRNYLTERWKRPMRIHYPPAELCTDNAAMIAWAGYEMFRAGYESELSIAPLKKWSLDPTSDDEDKGKYSDRDNIAFGLMEIDGWKTWGSLEKIERTDGSSSLTNRVSKSADAEERAPDEMQTMDLNGRPGRGGGGGGKELVVDLGDDGDAAGKESDEEDGQEAHTEATNVRNGSSVRRPGTSELPKWRRPKI